ncbi:MAG: LCP family protein [Lachnospiraceae bacterium]|nr:LCP family protein [Lachnospiraceae bacterium]
MSEMDDNKKGSSDDFDLEHAVEQETMRSLHIGQDKSGRRRQSGGNEEDGADAQPHSRRRMTDDDDVYGSRRESGRAYARAERRDDLQSDPDKDPLVFDEEEITDDTPDSSEEPARDEYGASVDEKTLEKENRQRVLDETAKLFDRTEAREHLRGRGERYARRDEFRSGRDERAFEREKKREMKRDRRDHKKERRKRHHILPLIILLIILLPVMFVAAKIKGMQGTGITASDLKKYISDEVKKSTETGTMAGYTNIALFGVDSVDNSLDAGNNRSDIMIIASINDKTGDCKLVSLYRDTYLDIGNDNYQKANAAYAYGGPEQAVAMLNQNLDLNIQDYAVVGFDGIASLIDAVGGIEMDVTDEEIHYLNDYQSTMAQELGREYVPITAAGTQTLNGLQATAYCRIRYTSGGDFKRTERQKEVLSKTFAKLKAAGPVTMIKVANMMMSKVKTSLNMTEIAALAVRAGSINITGTDGIPQESLRTVAFVGDQSCVIPIHLTDNVVWLHQYLFGDSSYQVSSTVQAISDKISTKTGY